ncbi:MAG: hypothetical protein PHV91_08015, partial [Bacteroidales bacterium]|nr:hypothetical protein [Bacteroidales bacterium]
ITAASTSPTQLCTKILQDLWKVQISLAKRPDNQAHVKKGERWFFFFLQSYSWAEGYSRHRAS